VAALADDRGNIPFSGLDLLGFLPGFDLQNAASFSVFMGLVAFSTATALLLSRERRAWAIRERALTAELASLRGADGPDREASGRRQPAPAPARSRFPARPPGRPGS